ncbi:MAG: YHYH protein [Deinococcota bacterium]
MKNVNNKGFTVKLNSSIGFVVLALSIIVIATSTAQTNTDSTPSNTVDTAISESFSTDGVLCDIDVIDSSSSGDSLELTSIYTWSCSDTERLLAANGIPDHEVGVFTRTPIAEQDISHQITLDPTLTDTATELGGPRGILAYALNGIKFDPGTAGTCNDSGDDCNRGGGTGIWSLEALGENSFNFGEDMNNAHVQPGGTYHYHGVPEGVLDNLSQGQEVMTLVGWASDGFPVYARYGYSDPNDASSEIKVITGSYQTKATPDENRPSTDLYGMGTFSQDWEYVEGLGDLDECNGRTGVTPEFPEGIYHYYATDTYPFMTRCVKGEVTITRRGPGNTGGERPERPERPEVPAEGQ